jgi:hypothetical protein
MLSAFDIVLLLVIVLAIPPAFWAIQTSKRREAAGESGTRFMVAGIVLALISQLGLLYALLTMP